MRSKRRIPLWAVICVLGLLYPLGVIAKSFGNSCLNNGLSEAVNKLSGAHPLALLELAA